VIVRTRNEVEGTPADAGGEGWRSLRMVTRADGLGFTVTQTTIEAGMEFELQYRNHLEACLCLEGELEVEDLATGERHVVGPGTLYALDAHDHHVVRSRTPARLVCVFAPALAGDETHDSSGGYAPAADESPSSENGA
jgi:L-ectoine synthase